ncbi:ATP-binding protein [Caldibacillus thermoamylovorans]|uniref:ATP-binding protein n=1 Tax=Caldibacillus thermoamylovorans TaxID=35841 RepID=UPI0022E7BEFA|nr:AAA family ATPase [Caldibacillus thermoamylovorans]
MIIKELVIYGYGKFEQYHLKLQPFSLIYGKNEAGKSTIMSFIHSILFGFPLKQQSELRYEPKTSSKYGGRIVLEDPDWGIVQIERVKGKAIGDVTVKLEDGTIGDEELLQVILGGMEKSTYQSIYSFDIHGLQNVQKVKGEELGKFLFSTSAIGTEQIMETDQFLDKEMDKLFKPNGSRPDINKQIAKMKVLDNQLKDAKRKIINYETLLQNLTNTDNQLEAKRKQMADIQQEIFEKKEWNRIYPLFMQRKNLEEKLTELGEFQFPSNGITRYEKLAAELRTIKKRLVPLNEQLEEITKELETIEVDERITENKEPIQFIVEDLPNYRQEAGKLKELAVQINQIEDELLQIKTKLHYQGDLEAIKQFDLSFAKKDQIMKLVKKQSHLDERKRELEKNENELGQKLKQQKSFVNELARSRLNEKERLHLENVLKQEQEINEIESELKWIDSQLSQLQNKQSIKKSGKTALQFVFGCICIITLALFWFDYWQIALGILSASVLFFLVLVITGWRKASDATIKMNEPLILKKRQLEKKYDEIQITSEDIEQAREKLNKDQLIAKQEEIENIRLEQLERQFDELVASFEHWENETRAINDELLEMGRSYFLPDYMAKHHLMECFTLLEQLKTRWNEKQRMSQQIEHLKMIQTEKEAILSKYDWLFHASSQNYEERVLLLKTELNKQLELEKIQAEKLAKQQELVNQIATCKAELKQVEQEINVLFQQANVETEAQFYLVGEKNEKRNELLNEFELVNKQLAHSNLNLPDGMNLIPSYVDETTFTELNRIKEAIGKEIEQLEKERVSIRHEITLIEEGGTYTELLHQFHQEKYELEEMARTWAVFQTAKYVLQKGMEKYKVERLPKVLLQASKYFSFITDGAYKQIFLDQESDQLFVERKDGMLFTPNEVSQATGEQLYISLRFALAVLSHKQNPYPFIIDDGFVHFDEDRRDQMMYLLKEISAESGVQILFFTCHNIFKSYFDRQHSVVFL